MNEPQETVNTIPTWWWVMSPYAHPCHGDAYHRAIARDKRQREARRVQLAALLALVRTPHEDTGGYYL